MNPAPSGKQSSIFDEPTGSAELRPTDPRPNGLRQLVATELSALFTEETSRRDNEWGRALESIKATLVGLDRAYEAASVKLTEDKPVPAAAVSELVEKFVAVAASDSEAAVQRTRAKAQVEIASLQHLAGHLQAELQAERDKLKTLREEIDTERGARVQAEAAWQEARDVWEQSASTFEARLHALQGELEAERAQSSQLKQQIDAGTAERAKLLAALQTVQRAVAFAEPVGTTPEPTLRTTSVPTRRPVSPNPSEARKPAEEAVSRTEQVEIESHDGATDTTRTAEAASGNRPFKLVESSQAPEAQPDPDLVAYADQLLADIEVMYWADLESKQSPADVVERLIANLRYAHAAVARRSNSAATGASTLFEHQLMMLMDSRSETSFGRHLGIAAYEYATSHDSSSQLGAEAS